MNDVSIAYCTAVYFLETRLVRKAMLIVPTSPAAKLSSPTINDKSEISASRVATNAKNKFVTRTPTPPISNEVVKLNLLIR